MPFFEQLYPEWKSVQREKYEQLFPQILAFLPSNAEWLDVGIGKGWMEEFFRKKGVQFKRVVGADISEEAVAPRVPWIEYALSKNFKSEEKFDVVVCWDALHLLEEKKIENFCKKDGIVLVGIPVSKAKLLDSISGTVLAQGKVGIQEQSCFVLLKE
ncbi:MAG: methyltransferase domain-containing protein [Candidatus Diapherotrites archaeon]